MQWRVHLESVSPDNDYKYKYKYKNLTTNFNKPHV